eukprot:Gb_15307 [translate_table: standard]
MQEIIRQPPNKFGLLLQVRWAFQQLPKTRKPSNKVRPSTGTTRRTSSKEASKSRKRLEARLLPSLGQQSGQNCDFLDQPSVVRCRKSLWECCKATSQGRLTKKSCFVLSCLKLRDNLGLREGLLSLRSSLRLFLADKVC